MRVTDLWERMNQALGQSYAKSWASDFHVSLLDGRTVEQALAEGEDAQVIWRAVHAALDLHPKFK